MPIVLAIKKYGKEHFSVHLLEELPPGSTQQQLDDKEVEWGMRLNTLSPNGYNLKLGGSHGLWAEEVKQKIRVGNIGKTITEETRKKLVESHLGNRLTDVAKKKLSDFFSGKPTHANTRLGAKMKNSKTCIFLSPTGEQIKATNMKEFCKERGFQASSISNLTTGKITSYRGWTLVENLGRNSAKTEEKT